VYVVGYGLSLATSLVTARVLGPEGVGILALVGVWTFYLRQLRPGWVSAAGREMPPLLGSGQRGEARRIQNVALTGELVCSVVPCAVLVVAGWWSSSPIVRTSLWISAGVFGITTLQGSLQSLLYVYQRFDLIVRMNLVLSVAGPIGVLLTLRWLGIYSPLVMPAVAAALAVMLLARHRELIGYRPAWDWATGARMAKVGFSLSCLSAVGWAYFMSDRPALLAAGLPLAVVGYYAFASNLVRGLAQVFWDFTAVLQPMLWQEIGRRGSVQGVSGEIVRVWVPYMAAGCAVITLGQAVFGAVVKWVAPTFAPSVPVFEILLFLLVFQNATQLPNLILSSALVNRQNFLLRFWAAGLVLNVTVLYTLARVGCGLPALAAASMAVDVVIVIISYAAIHRDLFASWKPARRWYGSLVGLAALTVGLYGMLQCRVFAYSPGGSVWVPLALRTGTALLVWGGVALGVRQWWVSTGSHVTEPLGSPRDRARSPTTPPQIEEPETAWVATPRV